MERIAHVKLVVLGLGCCLLAAAAHAQTATPTATASPTATAAPLGEPRCQVAGRVKNIMRGEGQSAASGQKVAVPVVVVEVESYAPVQEHDTRPFCKNMVGVAAQGFKPVVNFRLCDTQAEFFVSDRIRAVAGRNLGGGYYCIEQVVRTLK